MESMGGGGTRLTEVETPQQRDALYGILQAVKFCEWCADQCIQHADQNMIECIRLCEDVAELGEASISLVPRQSRYAQSVLGTFLQAAQACAQECSQHSHGHCQECAQVLGQTVESTTQLLSTYGQQGGMGSYQGALVSQQGGQAGQQVSSQTGQQVSGQAGEQVSSQTGQQVSGQVGEQVSSQTGQQVPGQTGQQVPGQFGGAQ